MSTIICHSQWQSSVTARVNHLSRSVSMSITCHIRCQASQCHLSQSVNHLLQSMSIFCQCRSSTSDIRHDLCQSSLMVSVLSVCHLSTHLHFMVLVCDVKRTTDVLVLNLLYMVHVCDVKRTTDVLVLIYSIWSLFVMSKGPMMSWH